MENALRFLARARFAGENEGDEDIIAKSNLEYEALQAKGLTVKSEDYTVITPARVLAPLYKNEGANGQVYTYLHAGLEDPYMGAYEENIAFSDRVLDGKQIDVASRALRMNPKEGAIILVKYTERTIYKDDGTIEKKCYGDRLCYPGDRLGTKEHGSMYLGYGYLNDKADVPNEMSVMLFGYNKLKSERFRYYAKFVPTESVDVTKTTSSDGKEHAPLIAFILPPKLSFETKNDLVATTKFEAPIEALRVSEFGNVVS